MFKVDRAYKLLLRMDEEYEAGNIMYKPDVITYNSKSCCLVIVLYFMLLL